MSTILDDLITGLNIISTIKSGQTLSKRYNKLVVIDHTRAEGMRRTLLGEDRYASRDIIKEFVQKSIELSDLLMESKYLYQLDTDDTLQIQKYANIINNLTILKKSLDDSIGGIKQTSNTYASDETLKQEYNTLVSKIEYHTGIIKYKLETLTKK